MRGGIDLGGTKIEAIVIESGIEALGSARHPTPTTGGPPDVAAEMVKAIEEACSGARDRRQMPPGCRRPAG